MTRNIGSSDRTARFVLGAVAVVLSLIVGATSVAGLILLAVGIVLIVTAAVRFCPAYRIFGASTCKADEQPAKGR